MQQTSQPKPLKSPDQTETDTNTALPVVVVRPATEADVSFIFNSWLKSYRPQCKAVSNPVYYQFQHELIEHLLARCSVQVACNASDASQIYGYLVSEHMEGIQVVHFAYVKHSFRQLGIMRKLAGSAGIVAETGGFYTHKTEFASKCADGTKWAYNPYLTRKIVQNE